MWSSASLALRRAPPGTAGGSRAVPSPTLASPTLAFHRTYAPSNDACGNEPCCFLKSLDNGISRTSAPGMTSGAWGSVPVAAQRVATRPSTPAAAAGPMSFAPAAEADTGGAERMTPDEAAVELAEAEAELAEAEASGDAAEITDARAALAEAQASAT